MKSPRLPLYAQILGWFVLNALLLAGALGWMFHRQFGGGGEWLLNGPAGLRVQALAERMHLELRDSSPLTWDGVLERFAKVHDIQLALHENAGRRLAGPELRPPPEILALLQGPAGGRGRARPREDGPPGFLDPFFDGPPRRDEEPPPAAPAPAGVYHKHLLSLGEPKTHWLLIRLPDLPSDRPRPLMTSLLARLPDLSAGGLILDPAPWLWTAAAALGFSALLWIPFVRGLTRAVRRTAEATGAIAEGRFDARARVARPDELGALAESVNRMAERLEGYVTGQKRFLGDVSHELCAPIARIQMALGILEQRAAPGQETYVNDLREEVQHMTALVNELLSFSKAGLRPRDVALQPVDLPELANRVVRREGGEGVVRVEIGDAIRPLAEPELLARALANLVRNALKYAGAEGRPSVTAATEGDAVVLRVRDEGPGVPEAELPKLFDPFYRVDPSRNRETGGTGLGLAIVKTCVEACRGTVTARLNEPRGLEIRIRLPAAP